MSLAELAKACGVARPNLSRIERDQVDPRLSTVRRIFDVLGLDLVSSPKGSMTLDQVKREARRSRRVLARAGVASSDPWRRLGARAARGEDIADEARVLSELELTWTSPS